MKEGHIPSQEKNIKPSSFIKFKRGACRFVTEMIGVSTVTSAEVFRANLVNPYAFGEAGNEGLGMAEKPNLNASNPAFSILQNSGDFYDGFGLSFVGYNALGVLDAFQYPVSKKEIPHWFKLDSSSLMSLGVVIAIESGVFDNAGTGDWNDVPAGALGAIAYATINIVSRRLIAKKINS